MDKDKILKIACKDKNVGREYENKIGIKSGLVGSFIALLVCICLILLEGFAKHSVNIGVLAVGMTASGVPSLYEGIKIKRVFMLAVGIIQVVIAIIDIIVFIGQVVLQ